MFSEGAKRRKRDNRLWSTRAWHARLSPFSLAVFTLAPDRLAFAYWRSPAFAKNTTVLQSIYISSLYIWIELMELVELLIYKWKSWKRSFNDQPSICRIYFTILSKYVSSHSHKFEDSTAWDWKQYINHRRLLKTFGNERVIYFIA